ncbi:hypothetical protein [Mangrovimonas xylaniphaga]|uniref:hypothetical protein n=1 Tax=Mangrovimonas xylaniphaga TaxID=1645915 RepID=UPI0006B440A6|nr:hypothetical protein [Mangrovimonas xylaniphaga]
MKKEKQQNNITRKEAMAKMGKYAALTAVGTFLILSPQESQAQSITDPSDPGGNPFGGIGG